MSASGIFADSFSTRPYWWDTVPPSEPSVTKLAGTADALIIGCGYTGLHAALAILRGGRSATIIDAEDPGFGCSSRNGGQVSTSLKGTLEGLARQYGEAAAQAILGEGDRALSFLKGFIAAEQLDCDLSWPGRFTGAHCERAFERLQRTVASKASQTSAFRIVEQGRLSEEIGSGRYVGGMVQEGVGAINPAKYHRALVTLVERAGGIVISRCGAISIARRREGFTVQTTKGEVRARDVLIATNGYTGHEFPELRRRIIPIASNVVATEELDPETVRMISPKGRVMGDTRRVVAYFRLSPDRRRLIYGGRVSIMPVALDVAARRLHREVTRTFPSLATARLTHAWHGLVGFTFDKLPHTGSLSGVHYCMGYSGSGISTASYFGMKAGLKILGDENGLTPFDDLVFPQRWYYRRRTWFMPLALAGYKLMDAFKV